jgi:hypothetical protein
MTLQDLRFALELSCVMDKDVEYLVGLAKKNGINTDAIDDELIKLGYDKVFEDYIEEEDDEDEEFGYVQKFPHKSKFYED